jgi:hypothetical protein
MSESQNEEKNESPAMTEEMTDPSEWTEEEIAAANGRMVMAAYRKEGKEGARRMLELILPDDPEETEPETSPDEKTTSRPERGEDSND